MVKLSKESNIDDIFEAMMKNHHLTILYVDKTDFCQNYIGQSWVQEEAQIVELDQEIYEHFQIGKVPQYRFYLKGSEVANLIGTVTRDQVTSLKKDIFGDLAISKLRGA